MSDWIDDELNKARNEDEKRNRREQMLTSQVWGLWGDLKSQIAHDVDKINQNPEARRRLGGDPLVINDIPDGFEVVKIVFPAIYLRIHNHQRYLGIEREIVTNGQSRKVRKEREQIAIELDQNERLYFKTDKGDALSVTEAARHLLLPFFTING